MERESGKIEGKRRMLKICGQNGIEKRDENKEGKDC